MVRIRMRDREWNNFFGWFELCIYLVRILKFFLRLIFLRTFETWGLWVYGLVFSQILDLLTDMRWRGHKLLFISNILIIFVLFERFFIIFYFMIKVKLIYMRFFFLRRFFFIFGRLNSRTILITLIETSLLADYLWLGLLTKDNCTKITFSIFFLVVNFSSYFVWQSLKIA